MHARNKHKKSHLMDPFQWISSSTRIHSLF